MTTTNLTTDAKRCARAACLLAGALVLLAGRPAAAAADAFTVMREWGGFTTFSRLIERAGLVETFRTGGPLTVFAPTDEAFARLDAVELQALESEGNGDRLRALVLHHVVPERVTLSTMRLEGRRATLHGKTVKSLLMGGQLLIDDAFIDTGDIETSNGLLHSIDKVLMPPS